MVGARINGRQVPIETKLSSGDRVEIITSQNSKGPSMDWLNIVKSTQAKNKINQWFKQEYRADNIIKGKNAIESYCKSKSINLSELMKPEYMDKAVKRYDYQNWDSLMAAIGHGAIKESQVVNRLIEESEKDKVKNKTAEDVINETREQSKSLPPIPRGSIRIKGMEGISVRFSKCCSPVPGDDIVGFVTRGRGVSVHRTDCVNVLSMDEADRNRLQEAEWVDDAQENKEYITDINIYTTGDQTIILEITKIFNEANITIVGMNLRTTKQGRMTISMQFGIKSKDQLRKMIAKVRNIPGVIDIERTQG